MLLFVVKTLIMCYTMQRGVMTSDFADSIIQLRSELRISQKELAEQLNISVATVNRWENGRTEPNKMTLFVIRDFANPRISLLHLTH